jgi:glutathione S-transferase
MRVLWLLHELGEEFELVVHGFDKSLRRPEYLAVSPAGRVPALEIGGEVVFESLAAMQVLCARFPGAGLGRCVGEAEWPAWLNWLNFAETISQHTAALTQQHVALYEDHMRSPVVMKLEAARLGKCFDAIEARLGPDRAYLLDGGFSAADIAVGQAVYMGCHFVRIGARSAMAAWYDRVTDRDAFRASMPPEGAARLYARLFYPAWEA